MTTPEKPVKPAAAPRREDHKIQKLVERIETKLTLQAKSIREASHASAL